MGLHKILENNIYYCGECNKISKQCYCIGNNEYLCYVCLEDVKVFDEKTIIPFLRKKRLIGLQKKLDNKNNE